MCNIACCMFLLTKEETVAGIILIQLLSQLTTGYQFHCQCTQKQIIPLYIIIRYETYSESRRHNAVAYV